MMGFAFDRESDGSSSSCRVCVCGVHLVHHHAFGNYTYPNPEFPGKYIVDCAVSFQVVGVCDGSCKLADTRTYDWENDFGSVPVPAQDIDLPEELVSELIGAFQKGGDMLEGCFCKLI